MAVEEVTVIYYTDNCLDEEIMQFCQNNIKEAAQGKEIISVSQKPIKFGKNICVGDIGRSHFSLFKQIRAGVEQAQTKYIALAEHDCLYTSEHFNWIPSRDDKFYYNVNHYFVSWKDGLYSYHRRKVLSMMIANTELTRKAVKDKIAMFEIGATIKKGQAGACEFGVCENREAFVSAKAALKDFGKNIGSYSAEAFRTETPQLDIRHGGNFSGNRRGKDRKYVLDYWGNFKECKRV